MNCISRVLPLFERSVKLLLLDDDNEVAEVVKSTLSSPLYDITIVNSLDECRTLARSGRTWHCWILDIDLGVGPVGLTMLSEFKNFQFAIVLSGLRSMSLAYDAMQNGAMVVLDKNPDMLERIGYEVSKVAALGYALGGKTTHYLPIFKLLQDSDIDNVKTWALRSCVTYRQLHRLCKECSGQSPRYFLSIFQTVFFLLSQLGENSPTEIEKSYNLLKNNALQKSCFEFICRQNV